MLFARDARDAARALDPHHVRLERPLPAPRKDDGLALGLPRLLHADEVDERRGQRLGKKINVPKRARAFAEFEDKVVHFATRIIMMMMNVMMMSTFTSMPPQRSSVSSSRAIGPQLLPGAKEMSECCRPPRPIPLKSQPHRFFRQMHSIAVS